MINELRATGLSHAYSTPAPGPFGRRGRVAALTDVSCTLARGDTVGLVGQSGSGKSTLLRVLLALETPTRGGLHLGDTPVQAGNTRSLRWFRRRVQYIPQDPAASLEPRMTVEQLVREPLARLGVPGDHRALVREALDSVGLCGSLATKRPRELSGGQAQRVALARGIVAGPDFLLADEPVSGLDLPMRNQILALLEALARDRSLGLVFVSHDLDAVGRLCARSLVLSEGRIVEQGPTDRLLAAPEHEATRALVDAIPRLKSPRS
ncbi:ATP-binding cassette domain-containing protein [Cryobacterium frigoriphilum]|uniref:ATP-binding cassette domain-containing protein n=1 Tax=Cryobacterium frigoriphilum TaxID=1259150 RepID=A0A4R9A9R1_9MICO|nr:ATP-binding cassette domain-containing protein [Cryobacterium frigoriphilum]TFD54482.1 ATP-binding cassette domain-containing protein [Cryobacterium frigoriphilum]